MYGHCPKDDIEVRIDQHDNIWHHLVRFSSPVSLFMGKLSLNLKKQIYNIIYNICASSVWTITGYLYAMSLSGGICILYVGSCLDKCSFCGDTCSPLR